MGRTGDYSFRYYTKENKFTKADIIERIKTVNGYQMYLPDDIKPISLSRDFLITVSIMNFYVFIFKKYIGIRSTQSLKIRRNVQ